MGDLLGMLEKDEAEVVEIGEAIQKLRERRRAIQERLSETRAALEIEEAVKRIGERHGRGVRAQLLNPEGTDVAQEVIAPGAKTQ